MSRLWSRKGAGIFCSVTVAYGFYVEIGHYGFCEGFDSLWIFGCLRFWFGKVINIFWFWTKDKAKKKKKKTFFFIIYEVNFIYLFYFVLEFIICWFLCRSFTNILCGMSHNDKNKNRWWFQSVLLFFKGCENPTKGN